jgi:hypothetical protein
MPNQRVDSYVEDLRDIAAWIIAHHHARANGAYRLEEIARYLQTQEQRIDDLRASERSLENDVEWNRWH